jgi:coatomer subunit beta
MNEPCYTLLSPDDSSESVSVNDFKTQLEKGDDETKVQAMKKLIVTMLNGEPMPQLLMFVIRFVVPSKNKTLKKLLLIYWEIAQKKNPDGKLKQEFILVW